MSAHHPASPPTVATAATTVDVAIAGRPYQVLIGRRLTAEAAALIGERLGAGRCAIVTDSNVAAVHLAGLEAGLDAAGRRAGTKILPPGEASKSFAVLEE